MWDTRNGLAYGMATLPTRTLGRTGVTVTQLGYGAMEVRGRRIWGGRPCTSDQAATILNAVIDSGITLIDTANDYGTSELFIGRHHGANRRDKYFLATKCGCHMQHAGDHDETPHIWTRENLLRNIADSLQKMDTDHVDLLQLHNPDVATAESAGLVDILLRDQSLRRSQMDRLFGHLAASDDLYRLGCV